MLWRLGTSVAIFNICLFIAKIEFKVRYTLFWLTHWGKKAHVTGGF